VEYLTFKLGNHDTAPAEMALGKLTQGIEAELLAVKEHSVLATSQLHEAARKLQSTQAEAERTQFELEGANKLVVTLQQQLFDSTATTEAAKEAAAQAQRERDESQTEIAELVLKLSEAAHAQDQTAAPQVAVCEKPQEKSGQDQANAEEAISLALSPDSLLRQRTKAGEVALRVWGKATDVELREDGGQEDMLHQELVRAHTGLLQAQKQTAAMEALLKQTKDGWGRRMWQIVFVNHQHTALSLKRSLSIFSLMLHFVAQATRNLKLKLDTPQGSYENPNDWYAQESALLSVIQEKDTTIRSLRRECQLLREDLATVAAWG